MMRDEAIDCRVRLSIFYFIPSVAKWTRVSACCLDRRRLQLLIFYVLTNFLLCIAGKNIQAQ